MDNTGAEDVIFDTSENVVSVAEVELAPEVAVAFDGFSKGVTEARISVTATINANESSTDYDTFSQDTWNAPDSDGDDQVVVTISDTVATDGSADEVFTYDTASGSDSVPVQTPDLTGLKSQSLSEGENFLVGWDDRSATDPAQPLPLQKAIEKSDELGADAGKEMFPQAVDADHYGLSVVDLAYEITLIDEDGGSDSVSASDSGQDDLAHTFDVVVQNEGGSVTDGDADSNTNAQGEDGTTSQQHTATTALHMAGQSESSQTNDNVYEYDPGENSWATMAKLPQPIWRAAAAQVDGSAYHIAGLDSDSNELQAVYEYDPDEDAWTNVQHLPQALQLGSAVGLNGYAYHMGGRDSSGNEVDKVYRYDPSGDSWSEVASLPVALDVASAAVLDGYIYHIGGNGPDGTVASTYRYDPGADSWTEVSPLLESSAWASAAATDGTVYHMGGSYTDESVYGYDPSADAWTELEPLPKVAHTASAVAIDGLVYYMGGYDGSTQVDWVLKYDPEANSWSSVASLLTGYNRASAVGL